MMSKLRRWLLRFCVAGLVSVFALALAIALGAWIPVNSDYRPTNDGVTVYLRSGPIHTDLILPVKASGWDWEETLDRSQARKAKPEWDHLVFGWGSRTFYLETRTWADVRAVNVAKAFFGLDSAAMHVEWCEAPQVLGADDRIIKLSAEQYEILCRSIREGFQDDDKGQPVPISEDGYGENDAFYEGTDRYTFYRTCNSWTGRKLAEAGVKIGIWTPTPWSVLWQLSKEST